MAETCRCYRHHGHGSACSDVVLRGGESADLDAGPRQALSIGIILMVISEMLRGQ